MSCLHERAVKRLAVRVWRNASSWLAAAAMLAASVSDRSQAQSAEADAHFGRIVTAVSQAMEKYRVPGVAIGVVREGRVMTRGFGVTSLEDPRPVTAGTLFPIAS